MNRINIIREIEINDQLSWYLLPFIEHINDKIRAANKAAQESAQLGPFAPSDLVQQVFKQVASDIEFAGWVAMMESDYGTAEDIASYYYHQAKFLAWLV